MNNTEVSLSENQNTIKTNMTTHAKIQDFLNSEIQHSQRETKTWNKLDKMSKTQKLYQYVDSIQEREELTNEEAQKLKSYLRTALDNKKLQRVKDVTYNKEDGVITDIASLCILKKENTHQIKRFTLKQTDKKDSTLKNLGASRKKRVLYNKSAVVDNTIVTQE